MAQLEWLFWAGDSALCAHFLSTSARCVMDCFFRYALAAGFLALPLSLFAEEKGSPPAGDHGPKGKDQHMRQMLEAKLKELKKNQTPLTQEQKEKMKAVMQQMEQRRKEMHSKLANWKENHPNDTSTTKQGEQEKRKSPGGQSKGQGEHFRGGDHSGGDGGHGDGDHDGDGHEHGGGHGNVGHGHSGGGHAGGHR
jgi:uncharacterized membrane protein